MAISLPEEQHDFVDRHAVDRVLLPLGTQHVLIIFPEDILDADPHHQHDELDELTASGPIINTCPRPPALSSLSRYGGLWASENSWAVSQAVVLSDFSSLTPFTVSTIGLGLPSGCNLVMDGPF